MRHTQPRLCLENEQVQIKNTHFNWVYTIDRIVENVIEKTLEKCFSAPKALHPHLLCTW